MTKINNIYLVNKLLNLNIIFNDCFFLVDKYYINKLFYNLFKFYSINKYVNITLVNKTHILYLNKKFNNNNSYTNVLSFKFFYPIIKYNLLGDIIICPKVILMESFKKKINYIFYFFHILIHGFLHLINFNHKNLFDYKKMKFFEYFFLNLFI